MPVRGARSRTGLLRFANAGHDVPYVKTDAGVIELRARGMPLGLMPGMAYEEKQVILAVGDSVLMHSDGIVEAHTATREMFGFPRLKDLVGSGPGGQELIDLVLRDVETFTGPDAEQEDDIMMLTVQRVDVEALMPSADDDRVLAQFGVASVPGNEKQVMARVARAVAELRLSASRLERLKTAVAEAAMNAIEHGNENDPQRPVAVRVLLSRGRLRVQISDEGDATETLPAELPDIEAKLAGLQSPRGWGLFLIDSLVDETRVSSDADGHMLELILNLEGDSDEHP